MEILHGDFHDEEFFCKLRVLELRHLSKESGTSTSRFIESLTKLEELVIRESYPEQPSNNVEAMEGPSQEQKVILPFSRQIKHLKALNVSYCDGLSSMFTPTIAENLVALTKLRISNCRILTEVISDKGSKEGHEVAFHHLKCMELDGLIELKCFSSGGCALIFPLLEDVIVNVCPNMKFFSEGPIEAPKLDRVKATIVGAEFVRLNSRHAFTPSMAWCLANIYHMEIRECDRMEGVIEDEGQGSAVEKISFPRLRRMILKRLPNLTSFLLRKNHTLDCHKIQYLRISRCPKMRSLTWQSSMDIDHGTPSLFTPRVQFLGLEQIVLSHMDNLSKIWTDNPLDTLTFDSVLEVKVKNCESLENLFPHWVATSLTQLGKLQVESCRIEEIVAKGDNTPHSNIAQVLFPKLTSLVLHDVPRLKTFCPNLPTLNWQFLKELQVTHCDKLNMLSFAASMSKCPQRDDQEDLSNQEVHSSFERV
ncbi:uncharacterized protein LOC125315330 [Rhodamnia argentea]|uniref:Uncharacterized protein LOC125315330 n=1 Tax=Rhodamnia argentea TaxID=178133 RepID=A0ABM3HGN5_9MYRT|nr:uncharacterized protein LOC125315330 [Rhodamnia argentea]